MFTLVFTFVFTLVFTGPGQVFGGSGTDGTWVVWLGTAFSAIPETIRLRKSGAREQDLLKFYTGIIRPVCEYAAPVWATSLTQNQKDKLENIQKRALNIIKPGLQYQESLQQLNLMTLEKRRLNICKDFF